MTNKPTRHQQHFGAARVLRNESNTHLYDTWQHVLECINICVILNFLWLTLLGRGHLKFATKKILMYFWVPVSYRLINIFKKVNRDDAPCFSEEAYKIAWIDTLTSRYCKS